LLLVVRIASHPWRYGQATVGCIGGHHGGSDIWADRALRADVRGMINNFNRLYYIVDGVVVTELDTLSPLDRWGTDPEALTDHLDAL
jgi:hypothetical protein